MNDNLNPDLKNRLDKIIRELEYARKLNRFILFKSFMLGLFGALGATVGVTILLGGIGFMVRLFGGVPVLGNFLLHLVKFLRQ